MTKNRDYGKICHGLANFLPLVGEKVMELRRNAENDPNFAVLKADKTIVTQADTASEDLIRGWIEEYFPNDSIRGEERKAKQGGSHIWIIDPIDGTRNFSNYGKMFGISVGLVEGNVPKVGVLFYPGENIIVSAGQKAGAKINGQSLIVSSGMQQPSEALVWRINANLHGQYFFQSKFAKTLQQQTRLSSSCPNIEGAEYCFTFAFLKFLNGQIDAILHPGAMPYDIGAMCAIAKELSLPFSGYDGEAIDFSKDTIPIVISRNAQLHDQIIKEMN